MSKLKLLVLLSAVFVLQACKLAVIVVEGGEVQSLGSGTCIASTICIVDVNDPNFAETFTAVPDSDWYFQKWNLGGRFFCGDSTSATCQLSFQGYEESEAVEDMLASSEMFYIMPVFVQTLPITDTISIDGGEWAQVDLFTNLSWDEINAVCPAGVCGDSATLNGYDMAGWTWASIEDIEELFNYYIGSDALGSNTGYYSDGGWDTWWANAFRNDGWRGSMLEPQVMNVTQGLLRDKYNAQNGYRARLIDVLFDDQEFFSGDSIFTSETSETNYSSSYLGGWFYRTP
jgi:hypothetical protein